MKKEVKNDTSIEQNLPNTDSAASTNEVLDSVETLSTGSETATASTSGAKGIGALIAKLGTGKIIAIIAAIVIVVGGIVAKVVTSTPKAIFKSSINNISKKLDNAIDDLEDFQKTFETKDKALYFTGDVKFDTNIEEIKDEIDISKYKLGMEVGINPKGSELLFGASVSGESSLDGKIYMNSENVYLDSSVLDNPINITELFESSGIDIGDYSEIFDNVNSSNDNLEDYTYVIKRFKKAVFKTLDSSKMEKSSAKMEVDGKKVSATKVTYEINDKVLRNTIEVICEELLEDDEFIDKLANISGYEKSDIKEALKEAKSEAKDMEIGGKVNINIYVSGVLNDVVGYDIEIDKDTIMSYYKGNKKAEFTVYSEPDHAALVVLAEEKKKETIITVRLEGKKIAEITNREVKDEGIDLDFILYLDQMDSSSEYSIIKGTIKFVYKQKKNNIKGDYELKLTVDDEYISASGSFNLTSSDKLDVVKTSDAISMEDVDFDDIKDNIEDKLGNDELGDLIKDAINEIEENSIELNNYGMKEVSETEAIDLLSKTKATVLYVGKTYYSYISEEDEYDLFSNLREAQYDYDFYSYYLNSSDVTSKFEKATKDAPYSCKVEIPSNEADTDKKEETDNELTEIISDKDDEDDDKDEDDETSCKATPVIYFIKDGKIVKALRSDAYWRDIDDALEEIGIK